jgi:hypothetical protein
MSNQSKLTCRYWRQAMPESLHLNISHIVQNFKVFWRLAPPIF